MSAAPTAEDLLRVYQSLSPYDRAVERKRLIADCLRRGGPGILLAMRLRRIGGLPAAPAQSGEVVPFRRRA